MLSTIAASRILMSTPVKDHAYEPNALRENIIARTGVDFFSHAEGTADEIVREFLRVQPEGNSFDLVEWFKGWHTRQ